MHALAQLPSSAIQVLGVDVSSADAGPTAEPDDWGGSFGRGPTEGNYGDGGVPAVAPMARVP
eukprot:5229991-Pyramimonas_sp.AAC.1